MRPPWGPALLPIEREVEAVARACCSLSCNHYFFVSQTHAYVVYFFRSCALGLSSSRGFSSWAGLGAFVEPHSQAAWQSLRQAEQKVASIVKRTEEGAHRAQGIDWNKWEQDIAHKDIVQRYVCTVLHCLNSRVYRISFKHPRIRV